MNEKKKQQQQQQQQPVLALMTDMANAFLKENGC